MAERSQSPECQAAVRALITAITTEPVLATPRYDRPFVVKTDAANSEGLGGVLSQADDDGKEYALAYQELVAMHVGRRAGVRAEHHLDHDRVRPAMDWRDRGDYETDALAKARLSWEYYPHDAERYRDKGLPPWVEKMMVEGAVVEVDSRVFPEDVDQYQWPDGVALVERPSWRPSGTWP